MHGAKLLFLPLTLENYISPSLEKVGGLEVVRYQYFRSPPRNAKTSQV